MRVSVNTKQFTKEMNNIVEYSLGYLDGVKAGKTVFFKNLGLSVKEVLEKYIHYRNTIAPTKNLEISGGIDLDTIKSYLIQGIDCISIGALTHHAISVDISLKIV